MSPDLCTASRFSLALVLAVVASPAWAAGQISMVLATEPRFQQMATAEWYRVLVELGVVDLQIRGLDPKDKPTIEAHGTPANPSYQVIGILTERNELLVPGGRFKAQDKSGLRNWIKKLQDEGLAGFQGGPRIPFGLSAQQHQQVLTDLGRPIDFDTKGISARAMLESLGKKLTIPLVAEADVARLLQQGAPLEVELRGVSAGTAVACALRSEGLVLVPRLDQSRQLQYLVATPEGHEERWPVGWAPKKPERDLLPDLFVIIKVEIDDIPLAELLGVVGERLKAPILLDLPALARQNIDPGRVRVSLPAGQSMYAIVLRKTLGKAKLKFELRADEADRPLIWVTTLTSK